VYRLLLLLSLLPGRSNIQKGKAVDIDYAFCKGCGICARVCPKKAIKMVREEKTMGDKAFLSGNEAVAEGVRLASPHVIAAYPITPQTVVVERLAEMVEDGRLKAEFLHVESEHSALSACMGAASIGARTFTALHPRGFCIWLNAFIMPAEGDSHCNDECQPFPCATMEYIRRSQGFLVAAGLRLDTDICGGRPGKPGYGDSGL